MSDAMQGCGPDCRAEEQGYPAPCEMYSDKHFAGCPRQSKAECCDALTLHAYDCDRASVPNTGTALSEEERSFMTRDWCIAVARTEEASELCALITRGKSALENWGRHHPWCAHASSPFAPCNCGLALEIAALAAPSRGSDNG